MIILMINLYMKISIILGTFLSLNIKLLPFLKTIIMVKLGRPYLVYIESSTVHSENEINVTLARKMHIRTRIGFGISTIVLSIITYVVVNQLVIM